MESKTFDCDCKTSKWVHGHFINDWTDDNCEVCHGSGINPQVCLSCDVVMAGDYLHTEDIGESNCRSIMRDIEGAFEADNYPTLQVWIPDNEENREILRRLEENYPIYDEDDHSYVCMEWQWAAFLDKYGYRYEIIRLLPEPMQAWLGEYQFSGEGENRENSCHPLNWDLFNQSMQIANAEWIYKQNRAIIRNRDLQKMIDRLIGQDLFNKMRMDAFGSRKRCGRSLLNEWFQNSINGEFDVNWDDDVSVLIGADKVQEDQESKEVDLVVYMRNSIKCQVVKPTITQADYVQMTGRSRIEKES